MHIEIQADAGVAPAVRTLLARLREQGAEATTARSDPATVAREGCELVDLTSRGPAGVGDAWTLAFDGRPGLAVLVDAVSQARLPVVDVRRPDGTLAASGRPGSEVPGHAETALADVLAGTAGLVLTALRGVRPSPPVPAPAAEPVVASSRRSVTAGARRAAGGAARAAYRGLFRAPHWRVGWRWLPEDAPDVLDLLDHPAGGWHDLPDDGWHFYADPFPFVHDGRTWLFLEDFDHRVGRGVVSVVEMTPDGPVGTPRKVLEHAVHLSYPFVFAHDGEVWMIPETSGAHTVELYRAASFPDRWELDRVLLEGVEASDATLLEHDGRWWMLATVRHGGSFSDTLHAWTADQPTGPWSPHPANPLLVDIASARPAGRMVRRGDRLLRPVQDNRTGYGAALGLMAVDRLDADGLDQHLLTTLGPGPRWPGRRLHTLNRAGRLEVVDGSRLSPRVGGPVRRIIQRGEGRS